MAFQSRFLAKFKRLTTRTEESRPEPAIRPRSRHTPVNHGGAFEASPLVRTFVDQLSVSQLSHFLIWSAYYDIVELPVSPSAWYRHLPAMEVRGWIALGKYIKAASLAMVDHEVVPLDRLCDELGLHKGAVRQAIAYVASPESMRWTGIGDAIARAARLNQGEAEGLTAVEQYLMQTQMLVSRLRPDVGLFAGWLMDILDRSTVFLEGVVQPRLALLRANINVSRRAIEGAQHLEYRFQAMQQERPVPLVWYGVYRTAESTRQVPDTDADLDTEDDDHIVADILFVNRRLREEVARLRGELAQHEASNAAQARRDQRHSAILQRAQRDFGRPMPSGPCEPHHFSPPNRSPQISYAADRPPYMVTATGTHALDRAPASIELPSPPRRAPRQAPMQMLSPPRPGAPPIASAVDPSRHTPRQAPTQVLAPPRPGAPPIPPPAGPSRRTRRQAPMQMLTPPRPGAPPLPSHVGPASASQLAVFPPANPTSNLWSVHSPSPDAYPSSPDRAQSHWDSVDEAAPDDLATPEQRSFVPPPRPLRARRLIPDE